MLTKKLKVLFSKQKNMDLLSSVCLHGRNKKGVVHMGLAEFHGLLVGNNTTQDRCSDGIFKQTSRSFSLFNMIL